MQGVCQDITDRKLAEEALRDSEVRARRALVEQMLAGVVECDATGMFKMVNQRFCEITGYTEAELLGMGPADILHPDDTERVLDLKRRLMESGKSFVTEQRFVRKDGSEVWINSHAAPVRNARGEIERWPSRSTSPTASSRSANANNSSNRRRRRAPRRRRPTNQKTNS